jgi:hypothetical protein
MRWLDVYYLVVITAGMIGTLYSSYQMFKVLIADAPESEKKRKKSISNCGCRVSKSHKRKKTFVPDESALAVEAI